MPEFDLVGAIMKFEEGEMSDEEAIEFFQRLIDTGYVWKLQGYYGRVAIDLIEAGLCTAREPVIST